MSNRRLKMDEWAVKCLLGVAAIGLCYETTTYAQQLDDAISIGKRAETLGIVGILAAVIVLLVGALVAVYRGKDAQSASTISELKTANAQLISLVNQTSTAIAEDAETRRGTNALLVEMKTVMEKCRK